MLIIMWFQTGMILLLLQNKQMNKQINKYINTYIHIQFLKNNGNQTVLVMVESPKKGFEISLHIYEWNLEWIRFLNLNLKWTYIMQSHSDKLGLLRFLSLFLSGLDW